MTLEQVHDDAGDTEERGIAELEGMRIAMDPGSRPPGAVFFELTA